MKSKQQEIHFEALCEAYRRVFGTDARAVAVLACEASRKTRREVERVYAEVMREWDGEQQ